MMIEKLKDFVLCFRCLKNWRFVSSSIVLVYDNDNIEKHTIKFIDFGRAKRYENEGYDMETCLGIENLIYFLL